ncbi:hypothetical protein ACFV4K_25085 [Nocardia sp. NPDC059764]|uniref:hypothetical protein n=1 Tax=Nocardia sp. NPDC059764 TaxID=3346939 RepID=UPI003661C75A
MCRGSFAMKLERVTVARDGSAYPLFAPGGTPQISAPAPDQSWKRTVSDRDNDELTVRLEQWLATRVDATPRVTGLVKPKGGGMSSATLPFDAQWSVGGESRGARFVARLAPEADSFPLFETYDLETQFAVMSGVADAIDAPLPGLHWLETDPGVLGSPFFVMGRVAGRGAFDWLERNWPTGTSPVRRAAPRHRHGPQLAAHDPLRRDHRTRGPRRLRHAPPAAGSPARRHLRLGLSRAPEGGR